MLNDSGKCDDGSVTLIGSLLLGGSDESPWLLPRLWLLGALLAPAIEATIYLVSPRAHLVAQIIRGGIVLLLSGLFGSLGGMKASLIVSILIESLFRCSKGKSWDAAFIIVFILSRVAGVYLLLSKSQAHGA